MSRSRGGWARRLVRPFGRRCRLIASSVSQTSDGGSSPRRQSKSVAKSKSHRRATEFQDVGIPFSFIGFAPFHYPLICSPVHSLGLGRRNPVPGRNVFLPGKAVSNVLRRRQSAIMRRLKLTAIGDLASPGLTTGERSRPRRFPEHRRAPPGLWTNEIPLSAAEVARERNQVNRLIQAAMRDSKPTAMLMGHVPRNPGPLDFFA